MKPPAIPLAPVCQPPGSFLWQNSPQESLTPKRPEDSIRYGFRPDAGRDRNLENGLFHAVVPGDFRRGVFEVVTLYSSRISESLPIVARHIDHKLAAPILWIRAPDAAQRRPHSTQLRTRVSDKKCTGEKEVLTWLSSSIHSVE